MLVALVLLLLLFARTMTSTVPAIATIFAWGIATFALVPPLQARVMAVAREAPSLAGSVNIGAFNLGNAIGAALGGAIIALGLSYVWVAVAGAGMAGIALALVLVTRARRAFRWSATRIALAMIVSVGLTAPIDGKNPASTQ